MPLPHLLLAADAPARGFAAAARRRPRRIIHLVPFTKLTTRGIIDAHPNFKKALEPLAVPLVHPKKEGVMTNQDDEEKKNMRIMWIASAAIVLFIVGLMFMIGEPTRTPGPTTDAIGHSRPVPAR
jgi:hypothetical protein